MEIRELIDVHIFTSHVNDCFLCKRWIRTGANFSSLIAAPDALWYRSGCSMLLLNLPS